MSKPGRKRIELNVDEVIKILDHYVESNAKTSNLTYKEVWQHFNQLIKSGEFDYPEDTISESYWRIPNRQGREIVDNYNLDRFQIHFENLDYKNALDYLLTQTSNKKQAENVLKQLEKGYLTLQNTNKALEKKLDEKLGKIELLNKKIYSLENILFAFSNLNKNNRSIELLKMQDEYFKSIEAILSENFSADITSEFKNDDLTALFDDFEKED